MGRLLRALTCVCERESIHWRVYIGENVILYKETYDSGEGDDVVFLAGAVAVVAGKAGWPTHIALILVEQTMFWGMCGQQQQQ